MEKFRVLIAVATHYSRSRAFESFLKEEGYDVRVATRDMSNKFSFWNFFREIASWRPRIVHVINDPEVIVLPVILAAKISGAKIIYDKRANCSLERKELRGDIYYYVERFAEAFGQLFYDKRITPLYKLHKEKNCVLVPQAITLNKPKQEMRHSGKKHVIFTAGTFSDMRGLDVVTESMKYIHGRDVELWIFGDGIKREELENAQRNDPRIKLFGKQPYEDYIKTMQKADVCIIPFKKTLSSGYTSPYSVLKLGEFTFFGKPTVCADVGDMRLAEKNGLVFYEPGNARDLAEKIISELKHPKKTTFFGELDRDKVKKKYLEVVRSLL